MDAIVLAGGLGTRLRSVVSELPKCMAPVAGKPFLWYLLQHVALFPAIDHVILSVGYLREHIFEWISEHQGEFPFDISYAVEETPLGTGGGIKLALKQVRGNDVVILNGDTFFNVDLKTLPETAATYGSPITIALKHMCDFDRYGTVTIDNQNVITSFNEKMYCSEGLINGGVYYVDLCRFCMDTIPDVGSFEKDVLEKEAARKNLRAYISDGYFIDIGIPEDYSKANEEFIQLFR